MILKSEEEVKKWLRHIPVLKKELELKIEFYTEIAADFEKFDEQFTEGYRKKIDELKCRIDILLAEVDRLFDILDDTERLVLTAKYIKAIRWDFIEFHVFYSRRQAIRIHNEAIKKLVGQEVKI